MTSVHHRWLGRPLLLAKVLLLAWWLPGAPAWAQAPLPTGDGLKGDYYEGTNFEKFVLTRRDATINFNWGQQPPAPGLGAELFSVRWTGWLVPPTSGKYLFHVTVDDGIRLWLNDQLIMNEWRGQPLSNYTAAVELRADEPYRLRVDYCQYSMDTRVFITWEPPGPGAAQAPSSWRNLWGMTAETPRPAPIPTQFLFRQNPRPAVASEAAAVAPPKPLPKVPVAAKAIPVATPLVTKRPVRPAPPLRRPAAPPLAVAKPTALALPPAPKPGPLRADSAGAARLRQLAVGETVTLPELYFQQGKAHLLPASRTALNQLATILSTQPTLRLEVQGHTDNVGNAELNRQLSQQRAEAVCLYLTAHGVNTAQLRPLGYGGTQPVADNTDPAQRPRNRRVVLRRL
ncbi:PA14 domain-containing protein [Hymenobacter sp. UYCo722]|uniref:PA14 domain-containing protein n=1 Tax=Hymenobacter sp. UYCo722 TaxID=3156335 RepID=UPI0033909FFF